MVVHVKQDDKGEHKASQRFGERVGRFVARVTGSRSRQMNSTSGQHAAAAARESEAETSDRENNDDLVFKMQPLSRRRIKIRVLAYRQAEPRFAYDGLGEETAAVE